MSVTPWSSLDQEIIDNLYEYPINWNEEWVEPTDEDAVCV
jgi:hypothetical protein